jgi:hypothetical protein
MHSEGRLTVEYAPFEWINPQAQLIIVGITPGETQAVNALKEAQRQLSMGATEARAIEAAKRTGAFSGLMRPNLVAMLEEVNVHRWAGVTSCAQLFDGSATFLQTASVVQYPAYWNGDNYNGQVAPQRSPVLRELVLDHFVPMAKSVPDAHILALGDVVWETMQWLIERGHIEEGRVLGAMPHPSPANNAPIGRFLGRPPRSTNPPRFDTAKVDRMRQHLKTAVARLIPLPLAAA